MRSPHRGDWDRSPNKRRADRAIETNNANSRRNHLCAWSDRSTSLVPNDNSYWISAHCNLDMPLGIRVSHANRIFNLEYRLWLAATMPCVQRKSKPSWQRERLWTARLRGRGNNSDSGWPMSAVAPITSLADSHKIWRHFVVSGEPPDGTQAPVEESQQHQ